MFNDEKKRLADLEKAKALKVKRTPSPRVARSPKSLLAKGGSAAFGFSQMKNIMKKIFFIPRKEMRENKEPIGRPRQIYTGSPLREFQPAEKR